MVRTQVQLPDELFQRAKNFSHQRELSLAELVRRSLEAFLARFPQAERAPAKWTFPVVEGAQLIGDVSDLRAWAVADEEASAAEGL